MTKSDSVELIERRLKSARAPNASRTELFDEQALAAVLDYSHGNPRSLLVMCSRLFGALLKEKRSKITYSDIVRAMEEERKVRLSMLQDREVRLLRMIEEHGSINAGDAEISKVLGVSRPRASQILRGLLQMGILVMRRKGKFVYYSVPEALKPLSESAASGD
jgi:DNA-binding transcriptional ArsR family regulator